MGIIPEHRVDSMDRGQALINPAIRVFLGQYGVIQFLPACRTERSVDHSRSHLARFRSNSGLRQTKKKQGEPSSASLKPFPKEHRVAD